MTTPANPPADLIAWLRAQLDEDERVARETPEESRSWHRKSFVDYSTPDLPMDDHTLWFGDRIVGEVGFGDGEILPSEAEHIARHDPARVLAEVDAKRRVIGWIFQYEADIDGEWGCGHTAEQIEAGACGRRHPDNIQALRALALPFSGRPGFREEWKPT